MFVTGEPVPVSDGTNTIFIKPKMDYGTKSKVLDELLSITGLEKVTDADVAMHVGSLNMAMLICNIVAWQGPAFVEMPCSAENIRRLDPEEPLVDQVLSEINRRNPGRKSKSGAPEGPKALP